MFVIMSGRVEVTTSQHRDAPHVQLATLETGAYFGEMSLLTGAPRVATVTALVETRLLEVNKRSFRGILAEHPAMVESLGAALRLRLAERAEVIAVARQTTPDSNDIFQRIRDFFAM